MVAAVFHQIFAPASRLISSPAIVQRLCRAWENSAAINRCQIFGACVQAERKKSRKFALRATLQSIISSFRTVWLIYAPRQHQKETSSTCSKMKSCLSG